MSRIVLFAAFQAVFALGLFLAGSTAAWDASVAWWPFAVTLTNVTGLLALMGGLAIARLLHWRPRLLPYLAIVHLLMNTSLATMFFSVAY